MDMKFMKKTSPYFAAIILQFGYAGLGIIAKSALNEGMSHYTFSVYRNFVAAMVVAPFAFAFERKIRPRMTLSILYKIFILALLEPVIDQNLYYVGLKYTSATFTVALCNILPAMTFLLAWALRIERVNVKRLGSQAKIMGTIVTMSGAMIMTLVKGSVIALPWIKNKCNPQSVDDGNLHQNPIKGALMIGAACFCWSIFYVLQAITLKSYPAGFSLTGLICMIGAFQGSVLTLVVERGNTAIWSIGWNIKLLAATYAGVICSGVGYYVSGVIMNEKGPVFVTAFNPLNMVIVAVLSSFVLAEQLNIGKVAGSMVIVVGLYLVIWGKSKDESEPIHPEIQVMDQKRTANETPRLEDGDGVVYEAKFCNAV
ncbi:hypothetical protein ACS0TY_021675 [Phlomoides rotata]